jgi:hypothetical protein
VSNHLEFTLASGNFQSPLSLCLCCAYTFRARVSLFFSSLTNKRTRSGKFESRTTGNHQSVLYLAQLFFFFVQRFG